ncbi:kinase-like domain-containing protein, partial [Irpex rosettiformis]
IARHTETCRLYVIKTYAKSIISYDTPTLEQAMKEQMMLRLLTTMDAQFIIKLLWSFQDEEAMHLVMDFCPNRDLKTYIECHGPLSNSAALICAAELVEALCNLHASDITHRRVRPEHILLNASGHIVLAGFSNASFSSPNTPPSSTSQQPGSCSPVNQWDAPEVVLGWTQDCAIDVWSFGLVLWYMLMGTVRDT